MMTGQGMHVCSNQAVARNGNEGNCTKSSHLAG
jgi:hypothetical protein